MTLNCEDGKLENRRFLLWSCSSALEKILRGLIEPNLLLILSGVDYCGIEALLQFIYRGEATFCQDRLDHLLKIVAKNLESQTHTERDSEDIGKE